MKTPLFRLILLFLVTALIGWCDYLTGDELDLFILYFVPIALGAWFIGARAGFALAVTCAVLWAVANLWLGHAYSASLAAAWGEAVFLATFIGVAAVTSRLRGLLDRERQLNRNLAQALAKVKKLSGSLPICIGCRSIQDERGAWRGLEEYFTAQSEDDFIFKQCVCPRCRVSAGDDGNAAARQAPAHPIAVG